MDKTKIKKVIAREIIILFSVCVIGFLLHFMSTNYISKLFFDETNIDKNISEINKQISDIYQKPNKEFDLETKRLLETTPLEWIVDPTTGMKFTTTILDIETRDRPEQPQIDSLENINSKLGIELKQLGKNRKLYRSSFKYALYTLLIGIYPFRILLLILRWALRTIKE